MLTNHQSLIPITIDYLNITSSPLKWDSDTLIFYVLSGRMTIRVNDNQYRLEEDDLILINAFDLHSYTASECHIAVFKLNLSLFQRKGTGGKPYYFDCNAATIDNKDELIPLKRYLALLVKTSQAINEESQLLVYAYTYELLHHLVNRYYVESLNPQIGNRQRLAELMVYINTHFREPITLKEVAEKFYLSTPYLSKTFKDALGINFKDYMNRLRLSRAIGDLRNLDWTMDQVAGSNGFASTRSFVQVFKAKYGMLPSEYRRQLKGGRLKDHGDQKPRGNPGLLHKQHLSRLATYLETPKSIEEDSAHHLQYSELPSIATDQNGLQLQHTFKNMTSVGMARHILLADFQNMLICLQKDVGYRYIKFHGLLDDEMMVYSEDAQGQPLLNFTYIDIVFDFLLSIELMPVVQLSYMPKDLAADTSRTINFLESHISLPKDYNKWSYLIVQMVIHLQNRYGRDVVRQWPFYLWNTPDTPEHLSGIAHREDYFHFYRTTFEAVKSVDPKITFGSPALMNITIEDGQWVTDFIDYCREHQCMPAFLNYHFYPLIVNEDLTSDSLISSNLILDPSPEAFNKSINLIKKNNRDLKWSIDQMHITEWNSSISHRELLNDTAFKPAYIVKNILENYDRADSFAFWGLSDFIEEVQMSGRLFHGGIGIFTYNGIKKAQYYAFVLLAQLGDQLLGRGDGYFVTKKGSSYQVILYNYQHYSRLYASGELFDMTFENRYTPFPELHGHKYLLPMTSLDATNYIVTDTILNREHGSAFDKWIELGAMPLETEDEVNYLKSISVPKIEKHRVLVDNNTLMISRTLEPHEVRLIEIRPEIVFED